MPKSKFNVISDRLVKFLNQTAQQAGKASGFVQRTSKLTAAVFVKTLVLGLSAKPEASLAELAEQSEAFGVKISPQGLDERLNERAVKLLQGLFEEALRVFRSEQKIAGAVFTQFSSIRILDSTIITLPAGMQSLYAGCKTTGGAAALKVHLSFEYLRGQLSALQVVAGRSPDQNCRLQVEQAEANSLHLFDLGYFKQEVLVALDQVGAFFISRLQTQTAVYDLDQAGDKIELVQVLSAQPGAVYERDYQIGHKTRLKVRLIAQRLPQPQAVERRRKALAKHRKKGRTPSATYLHLLDWNIFITNVPPNRLTAVQVIAFYRLRWQIELVFKLWKSCAQLADVGLWRSQRVLCFLYAKLIGLVLFHYLAAPQRVLDNQELSWPKAFRRWQLAVPKFMAALAKSGRGLATLCAALADDFLHKALKGRRKKSPSSYRRLLSLQAPA